MILTLDSLSFSIDEWGVRGLPTWQMAHARFPSDTPDTSPSPTHGTPFTETTLSTQRSPTTSGALRRRVMVLAPRQPIPHGRPYRYHLNGSVHMMTVRKRVGPLPTHRLAVRHSVDYSSSDDSSSDLSSSSSLETSSDSPADALSDSASSRSSSDHSLPASPSGTRSSHRLCSLVPSVHRSSAISERPSHDSSFVSRYRKRSRSPVASVLSPETATDLKDCSKDRFEPYVPKEVGLGVDFEDESFEPSRSRGANLVIDVDVVRSDRIEIDPEIQAKIDECFAYADALRDRGIDDRVVVEAIDREEEGTVEVAYKTLGDLVQRFHDHTKAILVYRIQAIEGVKKEQGRRIVGAESVVTILTKRVAELERDNIRLRDIASTPYGGDEVEQEEVGGNGNGGNEDRGNGNGGNGNGGNGNGNGNGGEYGYNFRGFMPARECTYQYFLKCQPLNFNGTECVVGLTRWRSRDKQIFHISNCPGELVRSSLREVCFVHAFEHALTGEAPIRERLGNDRPPMPRLAEPMKLMTELYCPKEQEFIK
ncbi:hypothetical protein Tco_0436682 [Tanacetum coccineum]